MIVLDLVRKLIIIQERKRFHFYAVIGFAVFVGIFRGLEEGLLYDYNALRLSFISAYIPFYFLMYWMNATWLKKVTVETEGKVYNVALIGLFLGLFPPILDLLFSGRDLSTRYGYFVDLFHSGHWKTGFWYFYTRDGRLPLGEALTLWSLLVFGSYYVYLKRKSLRWVFLGFLGLYCIIFFNAYVLPSSVKYFIQKGTFLESLLQSRLPVMDFYIALAQTYVTIAVYLLARRNLFVHLLRRSILILPFVAITVFGLRLSGGDLTDYAFTIMTIVFLFQTLLVQNDYHDRKDDRKGGRAFSPDQKDLHFFNAMCVMLMVLYLTHAKVVALPLVLIFVTGVLYSYPFYRGKRYFPANLKMEAVWGSMSFLAGLLSGMPEKISDEHLLLFALIFGGWSVIAAIKDEKDIHSDYLAHNRSLYTLAFRRHISLHTIHKGLRALIFLCLLVPCIYFLLHQKGVIAGALMSLSILSLWQIRKKLNSHRYQWFLFWMFCILLLISLSWKA